MVKLIRSNADNARYWHRLDARGCSDSGLVQPDKDQHETEVDDGMVAEFFEYSDKDPCPRCDWDGT